MGAAMWWVKRAPKGATFQFFEAKFENEPRIFLPSIGLKGKTLPMHPAKERKLFRP